MLIIANIPFSALGVPPRCRLPRSMEFSTDVSIEVADVTPAEAPVAFEVAYHDRTWDADLGKHLESEVWRSYRAYAGKVWVLAGIPQADLIPFLVRQAKEAVRYRDNRDDAEQTISTRAKAWADRVICIDGDIWEPADEPCIVIEQASWRRYGHYLSVCTDHSDIDRVEDGAAFRLDEMAAAQAKVHRLNQEIEVGERAELAKEPFVLANRVRNIRQELLTRPVQKDFQAQVRYLAAVTRMHQAYTPMAELRAALHELVASIQAGHTPADCDATAARHLHALVNELGDILSDQHRAGQLRSAA